MPRRSPPEEQLRDLALDTTTSMPPRTRAQRQAQGPDRLHRVQELVRLFRPISDPAVSRNGPLQQVRDDLHREIISILERAASRDDIAYEELIRPPMTDFRTIEEVRHGMLSALATYRRVIREQPPNQVQAAEIDAARNLSTEEHRLGAVPRNTNSRRDTFAVGVLVMLLNELIKLGEDNKPHLQRLYQRLLGPGLSDPERLPVFEHIVQRYNETEIGPYLEQIEDVLGRARRLSDTLRPPEHLLQEMERAIAPLASKRAEEEAETTSEESD